MGTVHCRVPRYLWLFHHCVVTLVANIFRPIEFKPLHSYIIFVITFSVKYKYERKGFNLLLFLIDRFFIFFFFFIRDKAHSPCLRFGWFGFDDRGRAKMNLILNC